MCPGSRKARTISTRRKARAGSSGRLQEFDGGKIVVGVGGLPYKCPVAPLEFTFLLEDYLTKRGLREKTEITYTFPIGRCFTIESVAEVAQRYPR